MQVKNTSSGVAKRCNAAQPADLRASSVCEGPLGAVGGMGFVAPPTLWGWYSSDDVMGKVSSVPCGEMEAATVWYACPFCSGEGQHWALLTTGGWNMVQVAKGPSSRN